MEPETLSLSPDWIAAAISPQLLQPLSIQVFERLARYIALLYRWNSRMNLTAVRDPQEMVALHLVECLRAAESIPADAQTLLDYGSGAGLPGIPLQLARPGLHVTLAESQHKKAAFLREAVRELSLSKTSVYCGRVESLPPEQLFDVVTMRAVDRMEANLPFAAQRVRSNGMLLILSSLTEAPALQTATPGFLWNVDPVPQTRQRVIFSGKKSV